MLWVRHLLVMAEARLNKDPTAHSAKAKHANFKKPHYTNTKPHTQTHIRQRKNDKQALPTSHHRLKLHGFTSQKHQQNSPKYKFNFIHLS